MSGIVSSAEMVCRQCMHRVGAARLGTRCPNDNEVLVLSRDLDSRPDDALLGRVVGGKFPIVGLLGEGGFGAVYRAVQEPVGRQVALKVIRGDAVDPDIRGRFFREAKVVASLSHPAIVTLHDYGEQADGLLYIAFELVVGKPLSDLIQSSAPMQPTRVVSLLTQILSALTEAHGLGLLHRDLKPDNLMVVTASTGEETVRILDFGLSKRFKADDEPDSLATRQGIVMGTPRYMSPEQSRGGEVDGRSDLYTVGVIAYEMLTGRPPFTQESPLDLIMAHIGEPVPPIRESLGLPTALVAAVIGALSKSPNRRAQTAGEFARELKQAVGVPTGQNQAIELMATAEHGQALIAQAKAQMAFGGGANLQSRGPSALDLNQEGEVSSSSPSAKRRSAAPVVVGLLLAVGAASAGIYLMIRPVPHTAPSAHTTAPSVEALGSTAPSVEAPGTLPMQPWERAVEFADAGRVPEAAMQMEYLLRSSKEPHVVLAKARADVRFKAVLAMPRVRDAILFMDPVAPGDSSAPPRP